MAAKKSIPKRPATDASSPPKPARRRRGLARCSTQRRLVEPGVATRLPKEAFDQPARDASDLFFRLSCALSLVETVSIALTEFEEQPVIGSISMALKQAIDVVARANSEVEHFMERRQR